MKTSHLQLTIHNRWLCHSSGSWLLASHCGGLGSCPGQYSEICGGQSGTGTGLLQSLAFPCQYHSTTVTYSFMYHLVDGQWACQRLQFH
jgi:hypothetical protein